MTIPECAALLPGYDSSLSLCGGLRLPCTLLRGIDEALRGQYPHWSALDSGQPSLAEDGRQQPMARVNNMTDSVHCAQAAAGQVRGCLAAPE